MLSLFLFELEAIKACFSAISEHIDKVIFSKPLEAEYSSFFEEMTFSKNIPFYSYVLRTLANSFVDENNEVFFCLFIWDVNSETIIFDQNIYIKDLGKPFVD